MARQTKFSNRRKEIILNALRDGEGRTIAVKKAAIGYNTFCDWLRKFDGFAAEVEEAEAQGEQLRIDHCENKLLTADDWQAYRDYLKLKHWRRYSSGGDAQVIRVIYDRT